MKRVRIGVLLVLVLAFKAVGAAGIHFPATVPDGLHRLQSPSTERLVTIPEAGVAWLRVDADTDRGLAGVGPATGDDRLRRHESPSEPTPPVYALTARSLPYISRAPPARSGYL